MAKERVGTAVVELTTDSTKYVKGVEEAKKLLQTQLGEGFKVLALNLQAVNKLSDAFLGRDQIARAHEYAAAVAKVGGATKLTATDQATVNKVLNDALDRYKALGEIAPLNLMRLELQTRKLTEATQQIQPKQAGFLDQVRATIPTTRSLVGEVQTLALGYLTGAAALEAVTKAGRLAYDFVAQSIEQALEAQKVQAQLTAALVAQRQATPENVALLDQLAKKYADVTVHSGGTLKAAQALLIQVGNVLPQQMDLALRATTNLAAGLGIDLRSAALLVAKSFEDNFVALKKAGVQIDETRAQAEGMDYVLGQVEQRFGGQAQAEVRSYAGQIQKLKNEFHDLQEQVGGIILDTGLLQTAMLVASLEVAKLRHELDALGNIAQGVLAGMPPQLRAMVEAWRSAAAEGRAANATTESQIKLWAEQGRSAAEITRLLQVQGVEAKHYAAAIAAAVAAQQTQTESGAQLTAQLAATKAAYAALTPAQKEQIRAGIELNKSTDEIHQSTKIASAVIEIYKDALAKQKEQTRAAATEAKRHAEALAEVASATMSVSDATRARILDLQKQGVAEGQIAEALRLTATQVKQVIDAEKTRIEGEKIWEAKRQELKKQLLALMADEEKRANAHAQHVIANLKMTVDAEQRATDLRLQREMSAFEYQLYLVDRWVIEEKKKVDTSVGNWRAAFDAIEAEAREKYAAMAAAASIASMRQAVEAAKVHDAWEDLFQDLARLIQTAFASGGGLEAALLATASKIGGKVGKELFTKIGLAGGFDKIGQGIGKIFGKGAEMAFGMAIPAIGEALGSLVGPLLGKLVDHFRNPVYKQLMRNAGRDWGISLSEGLAKQIEQATKSLREGGLGLSRDAAQLFNLGGILREAGGLSAANLDLFTRKFRDLFALVERGELTLAQASKVIDENFEAFAKAHTDRYGLISAQLREIMDLDARLGTQSAAIAQYRRTQFLAGEQGIAAALKVTADAHKTAGEQAKQIADLRAKLSVDEITNLAKIQDLKKKMAGADAAHAAAYQAEIDKLTGGQESLLTQILALEAGLKKQLAIIDATTVHSQAAADAISAAIVGAIGAEMASGKTFLEAVRSQGDAVKALQAQLEAAGFSGSDAFNELRDVVNLASDDVAGPILASIEGFTKGVVGLSNAGLLTADQFAGLEGQIGATVTKLEGLGYSHDTIMSAIRGDLQVAWELQQRYGFAVDETTQKLIDEAVANGTVGEAHKSSAEQQLDYTKRMTEAIEGLARLFGVTLPADMKKAEDAAKRIKDGVEKIPDDKTIDINYDYHTTGRAPVDVEGGGFHMPQWDVGTQGRYLSRSHVARLHAGEAITPQREVPEFARDVARALATIDARTREDGTLQPSNVYLDSDQVGQILFRRWRKNDGRGRPVGPLDELRHMVGARP